MSNFNTSYIISITNQFTGPAARIADSAHQVTNRFNRLSTSAFNSARNLNSLNANSRATVTGNVQLAGSMIRSRRAAENAARQYQNLTFVQNETIRSVQRLTSNMNRLPTVNDTTRRSVGIFARSLERLRNMARRAAEALRRIRNAASDARDVMLMALPGAILGANAVKSAAAFERTRIAIQSMVGSKEAGDKIINQIIDFTSKTTLQEAQVLSVTKRLKAYGVANEELLPTIKMLGNFSAALDTDLGGLALVYGQVRSKQRLFAQEVNQFGERGVPLLETLAKGLGVPVKKVLKLGEQGKLSFNLVKKALMALTKEGQPFHRMLEKIAVTTSGAFEIFTDNTKKLNREFGFLIIEALDLNSVTKNLTKGLIKMKEGLIVFRTEFPNLSRFVSRFVLILTVLPLVVAAIGAVAKVLALVFGVGIITVGGWLIVVSALIAGIWSIAENWEVVTGIIDSWRINSKVFDSIVVSATDAIEFTSNLFKGKFDDEIGGTLEQIKINFKLRIKEIKEFWFNMFNSVIQKGREFRESVKSFFADPSTEIKKNGDKILNGFGDIFKNSIKQGQSFRKQLESLFTSEVNVTSKVKPDLILPKTIVPPEVNVTSKVKPDLILPKTIVPPEVPEIIKKKMALTASADISRDIKQKVDVNLNINDPGELVSFIETDVDNGISLSTGINMRDIA